MEREAEKKRGADCNLKSSETAILPFIRANRNQRRDTRVTLGQREQNETRVQIER